jgi:hypothetical protein
MVQLGIDKGYIPISFTGNIIFVSNNIINRLTDIPYIISNNPYDYLYLYTNLCMWNNTWHTNTCLIFNTAIRNYYITFKNKKFDYDWIYNNIKEYGDNIWNYTPT